MYTGILPETFPEDLHFFAPTSTLDSVRWRAMNPAFYAIVQQELANPDSLFRRDEQYDYSHFWDDPENNPFSMERAFPVCCDIQRQYRDIPARVEYSCDPLTGELTPNFGIIDWCERGSEDWHNHYDYENTWETPLIVLDPVPQPVLNMIILTPEQAQATLADEYNQLHLRAFLYGYDFNDNYIYVQKDGKYILLADVPCKDLCNSIDYVYAVTQNNEIIQISPDGTYDVIYISDSSISELIYCLGSIYFVDDETVVRIDTITGNCTNILRCSGEISLDDYGDKAGQFFIMIRQGLYVQQYFFIADTMELEKTWLL